MLEVNKPIHADDPHLLLKYERGVFEVVSPAGRRMRVVCPTECPLDDAEQSCNQSTQERRGWWRIEKIASA